MSGDVIDREYDLNAVTHGEDHADSDGAGVPHGALLLRFTEAVLSADAKTLAQARRELREALGDAAFCDAAATVASFNAVVKLADGTGIPLEDCKAEATKDLRADLGLDRLRR
ncbi:MAG: alcohol dehydrogenase class IV [Gammaproteobacteria bacterium]